MTTPTELALSPKDIRQFRAANAFSAGSFFAGLCTTALAAHDLLGRAEAAERALAEARENIAIRDAKIEQAKREIDDYHATLTRRHNDLTEARERIAELERVLEQEREACAQIAEAWTKNGTILLRAGEMKAQELRSVKAVTSLGCKAVGNGGDD